MYYICRGLIIIVVTTLSCCKNDRTAHKSTNVLFAKLKNEQDQYQYNYVKSLKYKEYSLTINTKYKKDTLNVIDYKEDKYSSPVILHQEFIFFKNGKKIKEYTPIFKYLKKQTINNEFINALQSPIYEACLLKSENNDCFYIVNGSDYCNGSECLEFIGIYDMDGKIIFEGFSDDKKKRIRDVLIKYNLKLNNKMNCLQIDDLFNK